tara:strand:+ start:1187 stop:1681 length:495 start_codon:yes stop_codon:yes gene_type:complete
MALIIEDGSIVANANSYVTDAEALVIADNLSIDLPSDPAEREKALKQGTWYIQGKCFKGDYVEALQPVAFPRSNMYINGFEFPNDDIPVQVKNAQVAAASGYFLGANTAVVNDGKEIKKEKIDVLVVEYFENGKTSSGDKITFADQWLQGLTCGRGSFLRVVRC